MRDAYARNTDPQPSHDAARVVNTNVLEDVVLDILKQHPDGLIQTEVVDLSGEGNESITPRFATLVRKGLIRKTGEKRKGASGVRCTVYVAN